MHSRWVGSRTSCTAPHRLLFRAGASLYGHMIEYDGFRPPLAPCSVATQEGGTIIAEIIGFQNNNNLLCVHETGARIGVGAQVRVKDDGYMMAIGDGVLDNSLMVWAIA